MMKKNIHRATELREATYAAAEERRKELTVFVLSCTKNSLNDLSKST